jgi:hypothetical protein
MLEENNVGVKTDRSVVSVKVQQLPSADVASESGLNERVFSEWSSEGRAFKSHRPDQLP